MYNLRTISITFNNADFNSPFVPPGSKPKAGSFVPNEDAVVMVMSMGFSRDQAIKALKNTVCVQSSRSQRNNYLNCQLP
jgi:ubiquitin carboxyl-terminal hydrolase 5/13